MSERSEGLGPSYPVQQTFINVKHEGFIFNSCKLH